MTGPERRAAMVEACRKIDADGIPGDVVECGVWRGGNIIIARKVCPDRVCWLYDTFTGMTQPTAVDGQKAVDRWAVNQAEGRGWCKRSLDHVRTSLRETDVYDEAKLRFVAGKVEETLRDPVNLPDRIALLRLDTDWHSSTKAELEILYPRLSSGGVLIIDDYGHWQGCRKAVDEFFPMTKWVRIDYTAVMLVKP
jgi:O-methyltransferase